MGIFSRKPRPSYAAGQAADQRESEIRASALCALDRLPLSAGASDVQLEARQRYGVEMTYGEAQTALGRARRDR